MVTAYDAPGARMADEAGVDLILVGDSVAMVVLGYDDTLQVTVDDLAHHTGAVARGLATSAPERDAEEALRRRRPAVDELPHHPGRGGAERRPADPRRRPGREARGRPQAAPDDRGDHRRRDPGDGPPRPHPAVASTPWAASRCRAASTAPRSSWSPTPRRWPPPAASPSCSRACPTRSPAWSPTPSTCPPSASAPAPACDGQVLVYHDVLGIEDRILPKFVRRYADLKAAGVEALSAYAADVRSGAFPGRRGELPPQRRGGRDARPLRPRPHRRLTRPARIGHDVGVTLDERRLQLLLVGRARARRASGCGPSCCAAPTAPPTRRSASPSAPAPRRPRRCPATPSGVLARGLRRGRHHGRSRRRRRLLAWCLLAALDRAAARPRA